MKELKVLAVVIFFTLLVYWGVEPYAHSVMHKKVESKNFEYADLTPLNKTGDAKRGEELFSSAGCIGCHSVEVAGIPAPMDPLSAAASFGVNPPDLSNAGAIYDEKFLAELIKNPVHALDVEHKFTDGKQHPMPGYYGMGGDIDQEVADMVAYMKSIAKSPEEITPKIAYDEACGRCHAVRYEGWTQLGDKPKFKSEKEELLYGAKVLEYQEHLTKYMGKLPPDLSMYYKSRGEDYVRGVIEDPQAVLHGTSMPRVGVNKESADKIIEYLADSADTKRDERNSVGVVVMFYLFIFAILAYLWKRSIWRELH